MKTDHIYYLAAIVVLALAVWGSNARAETRLYLGAVTQHFSSEDYNERHKLVMGEHNGFIAGYFNNSYDEDSFLAGYKWRLPKFDLPVPNVETSVIGAATYGYRSCSKGWSDTGRDVCGMAAVQFDYTGFEHYHPSVVVTPVFIGFTGAIKF
jgi:hypothetical protein